MQINYKGKNMQVTEALQSHAEKKLKKLEKHFHDLKEATVTMSIQRGMHIVEVQVEGDGIILRGEERRGTDMYGSIDQVVEKLEIRAQKFKNKRISKTIEDGPKEKAIIKDRVMTEAYGEETDEDDENPAIVRVKKFAMKPMTPEEATQRMELLHHTFFMFRNADTENVNIVYKREDGNYGLIEPV